MVGLGLDGAANDTSDMFSTMRTAVGLQRAARLDAAAYPRMEDVLAMATRIGARILGLEDRVGSLTPGKKADVIMVKMGAANVGPRWNWIDQLVLTAQPANVSYVFINGKPLKERGELLDQGLTESLLDRLARAASRLKAVPQHEPAPE